MKNILLALTIAIVAIACGSSEEPQPGENTQQGSEALVTCRPPNFCCNWNPKTHACYECSVGNRCL
jgi:hypothetical protein